MQKLILHQSLIQNRYILQLFYSYIFYKFIFICDNVRAFFKIILAFTSTFELKGLLWSQRPVTQLLSHFYRFYLLYQGAVLRFCLLIESRFGLSSELKHFKVISREVGSIEKHNTLPNCQILFHLSQ